MTEQPPKYPTTHDPSSPNDLVLADRKTLLALLRQANDLTGTWLQRWERQGLPAQWPPGAPNGTPEQESLYWATVATELGIARSQLTLLCRLVSENNTPAPPLGFDEGP